MGSSLFDSDSSIGFDVAFVVIDIVAASIVAFAAVASALVVAVVPGVKFDLSAECVVEVESAD